MARRLQVWLTDDQYDVLNELANRTRVSMAEHIRTLIDREHRPEARPRARGFSLVLTRRPDEPVLPARRPGIRIVD
jgi:hypothetical protein